MSDDYHDVVEHTQLFAGKGREAPAIVRVGDNYFMFNSACSGWDPNACKMSYTTNLKSGWTNLTKVGNDIAYDTQAAAILKIEGTKQTTYLYVGDVGKTQVCQSQRLSSSQSHSKVLAVAWTIVSVSTLIL